MRSTLLSFFMIFLAVSAMAQAQTEQKVMEDTLSTVEVKGRRVQRTTNSTILNVNKSMREKHMNTLEMLQEFPNVRYNPVSEEVKINGLTSIAYQIDGVDKSAAEVRDLAVESIKNIEIIHQPEGIYTAEGIRYVVNVRLKENYTGLDFTVRNFFIASPAKNNGDDVVASEQPKFGVQFRTKQLNINATGGYGYFRWNYPITLYKEYNGLAMTSAKYTPRHPNQLTSVDQFFGKLAADYTLKNKHVISLNAAYSPVNNGDNTSYLYTLADPTAAGSAEESNNQDSDQKEAKVNVFYRGKISDSWTLNMNTGYNYTSYDNTYLFNGFGTQSSSIFTQQKQYAYYKAAAQYTGIKKWRLDMGAMYTYNLYSTRTAGNKSSTHSNRYSVYAYANYALADTWNIRAGLVGAGITSTEENRFLVQPSLNLSHTSKNEKVYLELQYSLSPSYPKLYQLSEASYAIDQYITQLGNPLLKQMTNAHNLSGALTLFGELTLQTQVSYNRNDIMDFYRQGTDGSIIKTYENARCFNNVSAISVSHELLPSLSVEAMVGYNYSRLKQPGLQKTHKMNMIGDAMLNYYWKKQRFVASLRYSKTVITQPTLQGLSDYGQDLWLVTLQKVWLKGRLRAQLMYVPPIHWGICTKQDETVNTSFYRMDRSLNLRTYDNMCFLRLTSLLHKGIKTKRISDSGIYDDESKAGRGLMGE